MVHETDSDEGSIEVTPLGRLAIILVLILGAMGGYIFLAKPVSASVATQAAPAQRQIPAAAPVPVAQAPAPAPLPAVDPRDKEISDLKAENERERKLRTAQAATSKWLYDEQDSRIAALEQELKNLGARVSVTPQAATSSKKARADLGTSIQNLQKAVATTKSRAVDVSSLPIDFVSQQVTGITGFAKDGVVAAGQKIPVGQRLSSGETLVAVDPETKTIVTDKRILNVTN